MIIFAISSIISQSVYILLYLIIKGLFRRNVIALNSLLIKIAIFTVCNRANNSASMLNIITIPYLFALQAISPLNSFIIYPYKLFLLMELSTNNALLVQINNCTCFYHLYHYLILCCVFLYLSLYRLFSLNLLHSRLLCFLYYKSTG